MVNNGTGLHQVGHGMVTMATGVLKFATNHVQVNINSYVYMASELNGSNLLAEENIILPLLNRQFV